MNWNEQKYFELVSRRPDRKMSNTHPFNPELDAIIIGAGMSGMYQLYKLRQLGLKALILEAGTGVGGTWYWNRYPGARFDSESYSYGYSFSKELLDEWDWTEHFSGQPEIEKYCNYFADKFKLRDDIKFSSRVKYAHYSKKTHSWEVGNTCVIALACAAKALICCSRLSN